MGGVNGPQAGIIDPLKYRFCLQGQFCEVMWQIDVSAHQYVPRSILVWIEALGYHPAVPQISIVVVLQYRGGCGHADADQQA